MYVSTRYYKLLFTFLSLLNNGYLLYNNAYDSFKLSKLFSFNLTILGLTDNYNIAILDSGVMHTPFL